MKKKKKVSGFRRACSIFDLTGRGKEDEMAMKKSRNMQWSGTISPLCRTQEVELSDSISPQSTLLAI